MSVPLLDLNAQNLALEGELGAAFQRVLRSGQFILGAEVQTFEASIAKFVGVKHAIGVSSGTDGILLALMALGIGPGDEVICPSFTFFATAGCVSRVGATPVFVDSCVYCFNLDVADAARKVDRPDEGDHAGPSLRSVGGHGPCSGARRAAWPPGHRGCRPVHGRDIPRTRGRRDRDLRDVQPLSLQEPRRVRRRRNSRDER